MLFNFVGIHNVGIFCCCFVVLHLLLVFMLFVLFNIVGINNVGVFCCCFAVLLLLLVFMLFVLFLLLSTILMMLLLCSCVSSQQLLCSSCYLIYNVGFALLSADTIVRAAFKIM